MRSRILPFEKSDNKAFGEFKFSRDKKSLHDYENLYHNDCCLPNIKRRIQLAIILTSIELWLFTIWSYLIYKDGSDIESKRLLVTFICFIFFATIFSVYSVFLTRRKLPKSDAFIKETCLVFTLYVAVMLSVNLVTELVSPQFFQMQLLLFNYLCLPSSVRKSIILGTSVSIIYIFMNGMSRDKFYDFNVDSDVIMDTDGKYMKFNFIETVFTEILLNIAFGYLKYYLDATNRNIQRVEKKKLYRG